MASVVIAGNTSGTVTLSAPDISGSTVLTLPTTSGTLVTTAGGSTVPFALGSAASPSITFTGDTNTGIFSPGADTIGFAEGGAEVARFDSSGNFGIGTTGPRGLLDLNNSRGAKVYFGTAGTIGETQSNAGDYIANNLFVSAESAGTITYTKITNDVGNTILQDFSRGITFYTGATGNSGTTGTLNNFERMRIDSSGRVGIGTSSPGSYDSSSLMAVASNSNTSITIASGSTGLGQILFANGTSVPNIYNGLIRYDHNGNSMSFFTNGGNQRMILDNAGNLMIGTATSRNQRLQVVAPSGVGTLGLQVGANGNGGIDWYNASGGYVASVIVNAGSVAYNTTSDYRLKENVSPMTGALAKVSALKPVTWSWKNTGEQAEGFIAHELAEVCPDAVSGQKDATKIEQYEISPAVLATYDEEGNELTPAVKAVMGEREVPVYQGIDTSFLVATLTAAIQEQQAIINEQASTIAAFEARLVALENK
jgi:hypothetical protein